MKHRVFGLTPAAIFFIAMFLLLGVVSGVAWYQGYQQADTKSTVEARAIAAKLNSYVQGNAHAPDSLTEIYTEVDRSTGAPSIPPSVSYAKLSYTSYKFCIDYHLASSGKSMALSQSQLVIPDRHSRGQNCQTIHPYIDPIQISGSLRICDQMVNKEMSIDTENAGNISSLNSVNGSDLLVMFDNVTRGTSGPFLLTKADTTIYNNRCDKLALDTLKPGMPMYLFLNDADHYVAVQEPLNWH